MASREKKYILAIDHGTGGPKSAIVSTHGEVLEWAFQEVPLHLLNGGGAEQYPDDWCNAILLYATVHSYPLFKHLNQKTGFQRSVHQSTGQFGLSPGIFRVIV